MVNGEVFITFLVLFILFIILFIIIFFKFKDEEYEETEKILVTNKIVEKKDENCLKINKIPRRIVQTYFSRNLPKRMHKAAESFKELNPDFEYIFYDDDEIRKFLKENYNENDRVLEAFDLLIPGAYKADIFRLAELYINGGYYADVFMLNIETLEYLEQYDVDCILTKDIDIFGVPGIYNGFMGCKPKNKIIEYILRKTVNNVIEKNIGKNCLDITGPSFIGKILMDYLNLRMFPLGVLEKEKLLILEYESYGPYAEENHIKDINKRLIKAKYKNFKKDIPKGIHYNELYPHNVFKNL